KSTIMPSLRVIARRIMAASWSALKNRAVPSAMTTWKPSTALFAGKGLRTPKGSRKSFVLLFQMAKGELGNSAVWTGGADSTSPPCGSDHTTSLSSQAFRLLFSAKGLSMRTVDDHGTFEDAMAKASADARELAYQLRKLVVKVLPNVVEVPWPKM